LFALHGAAAELARRRATGCDAISAMQLDSVARRGMHWRESRLPGRLPADAHEVRYVAATLALDTPDRGAAAV
jgi:hypothetical protein